MDWMEIAETKVFKSFDMASEYLSDTVCSHLNDKEDDWNLDYKYDFAAHLTCPTEGGADEAALLITEHTV